MVIKEATATISTNITLNIIKVNSVPRSTHSNVKKENPKYSTQAMNAISVVMYTIHLKNDFNTVLIIVFMLNKDETP